MKSLSSAFALAVCIALPGGAQEPAKPAPWTYEEARELLEISPRDPYAQYLAVLLAKKAGREQEVFQLLDRSAQGDARFGRARQVDLFNLFSGALAVQESLQLDTLRGGGGAPRGRGFDQAPFDDRAAPTEPKAADPNARPLDQPAIKSERVDDPKEEAKVAVPDGEIRESVKQPAGRANQPPRRGRKSPDAARDVDKVAISSLVGPTIKSHPWKEMLAGKKPEIEPMAMCVPADNYYVAFRSIGKMLELEDSADLWGIQILSQTARDATTQNVGQRLKAQLAIETTPLLRPFYDLVVESVAITGSDLYVREGSDVTLIFRLRTPDVFRARMDGFLDSAAKANPTARRADSAYGGVAYRGLVSADRRVSVYSAYPSANLHVRSNSLVGLQRALAAIRGQDPAGKRVTRLGETEEFAYIRTLMPKGAPEEDGFIYLSDPFIRNVVGPAQKLAERRRMICFNHLKMAGHGVAMHRAQTGANPGSFQQLVASGSAPGEYGKGPWSCPDGGTVRLDGVCAECSRHGRCDFMIPNAEAPLESVTRDEAQQYAAFLQEYNQYWRTFFDPIAIRIKADADRYRAETIVLPLINSSVYQNVAGMVGGKPEPLDAMPVPARNIFSLAFRVPKERAMEELGLSAPTPVEKRADAGAASEAQAVESLRMIGLALHNYADSYRWFPSAVGFDKQGGKTRLGWRVAILPYLEEQALFDQFRHDEPWDGPHNKALIAKMPKIYRSGDAKLDAEGKTTFTSPRGKNTLFPAENRAGRKLSDVLDGLSFTVMAVEADAAHAVTWTAPDDLPFDPATPFKGWRERPRGRMLLTADGAVHYLPTHVPAARAATYFTVAGGEVNQGEGDFDTPQFRGQGGGPVGSRSPVPPEIAEELKLKALLERGVGNQVGVHVYDAQQLIDFNLPSFLGMGLGSFGGRGMFGNGEAFVGFAITALTSPVYVSIPVRDRAIVDECLTRLDALLLKQSREREGFGFFSFSQDYYSFAAGDAKVRTYAVQIGPVRWRMFAARIGDGLYVASKPFILEDLAAAWKTAPQSVPADPGPAAHAIVRLRPQNWNQTLPDYRLGWAENNRMACHRNLGALVAALRSAPMKDGKPDLLRAAAEIYGVGHYCPENGTYRVGGEGKQIECTVHGKTSAPVQPIAPVADGPFGQAIAKFKGATLALTLLEDGLHAVVTVERK